MICTCNQPVIHSFSYSSNHCSLTCLSVEIVDIALLLALEVEEPLSDCPALLRAVDQQIADAALLVEDDVDVASTLEQRQLCVGNIHAQFFGGNLIEN